MDETSEEFTKIDAQFQTVRKFVADKRTLVARFQLATIVLSVLTSGSLWLLLSKLLPDLTVWVGAFASSLTAGIALYMKTIDQSITDAYSLEHDIAAYLAEIRKAPNQPADYYDKHKDFIVKIDKLRPPIRR